MVIDILSAYLDNLRFRISNSARYTRIFQPSTTDFTTDANTFLCQSNEHSQYVGAGQGGAR